MGSSKKGMLNVLIAAVLWGSSGVCAQFIMQESQMSSPFLTMTRLLFAGLILLMLGFVHGDRIFRVLQNRRDALSLLFFSLFGALTVQFTFLMTIEKSNAATATVLQFLSPTIIVARFALARKARPTPLVLGAICTSLAGTFLLVTHGNPTTLSISPAALFWGSPRRLPPPLYHLSFNADCPLRDAAHRRLEHAVRRRDVIAVLRRPGHRFCG
ncbi:hypothetical protein KPZU09_53350 [Klebsiella pneumoniae]|uniref:EamA domain-containing protein n=1 Tax=Klebsiella pneumoniae TaxID=573 RepID=A0A919HVR3_KLEPN|nr:hypothetical protein KPZU09_53350 [Klebsiella pneumoniae]